MLIQLSELGTQLGDDSGRGVSQTIKQFELTPIVGNPFACVATGMRRALAQRRTRWMIIVALTILELSAVAWHKRRYWTQNNFRAVVPGAVYAGGYQYSMPLSGTIWENQIRTIVTLLPEGSEDDAREQRTASSRAVTFRRVVIPFTTPDGESFSSPEEFTSAQLAAVETAVSVIADPANQPVFVHCRGGNHRTGAVVAVFRVQHCGWTEEQARAELAQWGGYLGDTTWPSQVLHAFCASHSGVEPVLYRGQ